MSCYRCHLQGLVSKVSLPAMNHKKPRGQASASGHEHHLQTLRYQTYIMHVMQSTHAMYFYSRKNHSVHLVCCKRVRGTSNCVCKLLQRPTTLRRPSFIGSIVKTADVSFSFISSTPFNRTAGRPNTKTRRSSFGALPAKLISCWLLRDANGGKIATPLW